MQRKPSPTPTTFNSYFRPLHTNFFLPSFLPFSLTDRSLFPINQRSHFYLFPPPFPSHSFTVSNFPHPTTAMNFPLSLLLLLLSLFSTAATDPTLRRQSNSGVALELWCVAKNNAEDAALQSALDWACGSGGANCGPIQNGGPCYDPADIQRTASYAFNDYYLKNGLADDSCNFDNTAALTSLNPSHTNCKFPSSMTVKNRNSTTTVGNGQVSADISKGHFIEARWVLGFIFIHIYLFQLHSFFEEF